MLFLRFLDSLVICMRLSLFVYVALLLGADALAASSRASVLLVGGNMTVCSDRSPEACTPGFFANSAAHLAARYRIDSDGIARLSTGWLEHRGKVRDAVVEALEAMRKDGDVDLDRSELASKLGATWTALATFEQERVTDALELPSETERTLLTSTKEPKTRAILDTFSGMAREVSLRGRPRILVFTGSSRDPFESVAHYTEAFSQTDAKVLWLPLDMAVRAAQRNPVVDCERLDAIRGELGGAHDRARLNRMRAEQMKSACTNTRMLTDLLLWTDAVFINGGDQSFTRAAWFNADGTPSVELELLRKRHAAGEIVIGGTSAGAAVLAYSGAMMVSGQDVIGKAKAIETQPPRLGCAVADACEGTPEFALLYHPGGGLGSFDLGVVDTHFSERGREWRLARLLLDAELPLGLGVDETTAVRLDRVEKGYLATVVGVGSVTIVTRRDKDAVVLQRFNHDAKFELPGKPIKGKCKGKALTAVGVPVDSGELRKALDVASEKPAPTPLRIGDVAAGQACGVGGALLWEF